MAKDEGKSESKDEAAKDEEKTPEIEEKEASKKLSGTFGKKKTAYTARAATQVFEVGDKKVSYFYVDYVLNNAWYTRYNRDANTIETPTSVSEELNVNNLVAIKNGPDGELYFVALMTQGEIGANNHGEGSIYKLEAAE